MIQNEAISECSVTPRRRRPALQLHPFTLPTIEVDTWCKVISGRQQSLYFNIQPPCSVAKLVERRPLMWEISRLLRDRLKQMINTIYICRLLSWYWLGYGNDWFAQCQANVISVHGVGRMISVVEHHF